MSIKELDFYVTLVHYPVKDKIGDIVATAVTNLDVHDIARLTTSFGFKGYYIVTPVEEQKALVNRIVEHWTNGIGVKRNIKRSTALKSIRVSSSIESAISDIENLTGKRVETVATSAKVFDDSIEINDLVSNISEKFAYLFLFGTGWGLTDETCRESDYIITSLSYDTGYNHLSVRSAVSIIMDRLYNALNQRG